MCKSSINRIIAALTLLSIAPHSVLAEGINLDQQITDELAQPDPPVNPPPVTPCSAKGTYRNCLGYGGLPVFVDAGRVGGAKGAEESACICANPNSATGKPWTVILIPPVDPLPLNSCKAFYDALTYLCFPPKNPKQTPLPNLITDPRTIVRIT